jgi:predicted nucleic acid-binding protein
MGLAARHEVFICDATIAEYIAGKPLKDAGKEQRWRNFWDSFVSRLESVPLDHQVCEKAGELLADARRAGKRFHWVMACMPPSPNWKI